MITVATLLLTSCSDTKTSISKASPNSLAYQKNMSVYLRDDIKVGKLQAVETSKFIYWEIDLSFPFKYEILYLRSMRETSNYNVVCEDIPTWSDILCLVTSKDAKEILVPTQSLEIETKQLFHQDVMLLSPIE